MGHLEGNFTPVLYIGRKVPKVQHLDGPTRRYIVVKFKIVNSTGKFPVFTMLLFKSCA
jgi:hypothetical protein